MSGLVSPVEENDVCLLHDVQVVSTVRCGEISRFLVVVYVGGYMLGREPILLEHSVVRRIPWRVLAIGVIAVLLALSG